VRETPTAKLPAAYLRGYTAGKRTVDPCKAYELADARREPAEWYVGFVDANTGEPRGFSLTLNTCPKEATR